MANLHGKWSIISGYYNTNPSLVLDCSLECYADLNPAGENGIDRVEFVRTINGGGATTITVSSPSVRTPNFSLSASPVPGVSSGSMASFYGYGISLDLGALGPGRIQVTATIYTRAGTTKVMPAIVVFNNTDGSVPPPNTSVMYVDASLGNNSNSGTSPGSAKKTLGGAIRGLAAATGGDIGGGLVVMLPGNHAALGTTPFGVDAYTSDHWWCNVLFLPGATQIRDDVNFIFYPKSGPGLAFRMRLFGSGFLYDDGFAAYVWPGNQAFLWVDGCYSGSQNYVPTKPWSVLYGNTGRRAGAVGFDGDVTNGFRYATCHVRAGTTFGLLNWHIVLDTIIQDMQGVMLQSAGPGDADYFSRIVLQRHRYATNEVLGYIDTISNGADMVISVPAAGQMRIDTTAPIFLTANAQYGTVPTSFSTQCQELVGAATWGLRCVGMQNGNNGTFLVLAAGTNGGNSYVILANQTAVAGVMQAGSRITTASYNPTNDNRYGTHGALYVDMIHTDQMQAYGSRNDCMWSYIAARDIAGIRGFVDSGFPMARCALVNCSNGGFTANNDWGSQHTDSFFAHNTLHFMNMAAGNLLGRCNVVDNVFNSQGNMSASGNVYISGNHFITGATVGANATSGSWYSGNPTVDPWALTPASNRLGTASGLLPGPSQYWWTGAVADSRGVWRNVGEINWSTPAGGGESIIIRSLGDITITPPDPAVVTGTATSVADLSALEIRIDPPTPIVTIEGAIPTQPTGPVGGGGGSGTRPHVPPHPSIPPPVFDPRRNWGRFWFNRVMTPSVGREVLTTERMSIQEE